MAIERVLITLVLLWGTARSGATTLKEAAKGSGIYIGTAMNYKDLQNDATYGELAA